MERVDYESLVIQDLLNWVKSDDLDLEPWYQRRSVWTPAQQSFLINTLLAQKPVPTIYIRHKLDLEREKSVRELVDGQQRVRSILAFYNGDISVRHPITKKRVSFNNFSPKDKTSFLMTKLSVGYLISADESDVIDIFGRINSIAKTLNSQEKRNAKFSGELKQFCLDQSSKRLPFWRTNQIFSANDIARMSEVQFISDLVLNLEKGLSDYSSAKLDKFYQEHEDIYPNWATMEARLDSIFSRLAELPVATIRDTVFRRPPLFFSLALVLDKQKRASKKKIESAIGEIDRRFVAAESGEPSALKKDIAFMQSTKASTQRIASRRVRDAYIGNYLGK